MDVLDSVTVSIAALTRVMLHVIFFVKGERVSTSRGNTSE